MRTKSDFTRDIIKLTGGQTEEDLRISQAVNLCHDAEKMKSAVSKLGNNNLAKGLSEFLTRLQQYVVANETHRLSLEEIVKKLTQSNDLVTQSYLYVIAKLKERWLEGIPLSVLQEIAEKNGCELILSDEDLGLDELNGGKGKIPPTGAIQNTSLKNLTDGYSTVNDVRAEFGLKPISLGELGSMYYDDFLLGEKEETNLNQEDTLKTEIAEIDRLIRSGNFSVARDKQLRLEGKLGKSGLSEAKIAEIMNQLNSLGFQIKEET